MAGNLLAIRAFLWYTADGQLKNGRCAGERKQHPAAEWGEKPRERVTVMPARLRQAKSDTYVPEPVGFAIPEAKMRSAAHGHFRPCALLYAGAWPGEAVCLFLLPQAADERKILHKRGIPFMLSIL